MPANAGNTRPRKPKITNPDQKEPDTTLKNRKTTHPKQPELTPDQNKEFKRVRAAEALQRRHELGLCRNCTNQAIKGQTLCSDCDKTHGVVQRQQRSRARTGKGLTQESHIVPGTEGKAKPENSPSQTKPRKPSPSDKNTTSVKRQEYERLRGQRPERKEAVRQAVKKRRHDRIAAGLCIGCEAPPIPGETRCEVCAEKHRIARRKSAAKTRGRPTPEGTTPTDAN